jgi:hypothetical protein
MWFECEHCSLEWWTVDNSTDPQARPCGYCRHRLLRRVMEWRRSGRTDAVWSWPRGFRWLP